MISITDSTIRNIEKRGLTQRASIRRQIICHINYLRKLFCDSEDFDVAAEGDGHLVFVIIQDGEPHIVSSKFFDDFSGSYIPYAGGTAVAMIIIIRCEDCVITDPLQIGHPCP